MVPSAAVEHASSAAATVGIGVPISAAARAMYRNRTDPAILRIVRVRHPVVAVWGGIVLLVCLGLARPSDAEPPASTGVLELYDALPPESPVRVRVGDGQQFSVWVAGEGLRYQWMVDGGPVVQRRSWLFAPQETDVGPHLVTVAVDGPDGRATWTWRVQVVSAESPISPPTHPRAGGRHDDRAADDRAAPDDAADVPADDEHAHPHDDAAVLDDEHAGADDDPPAHDHVHVDHARADDVVHPRAHHDVDASPDDHVHPPAHHHVDARADDDHRRA